MFLSSKINLSVIANNQLLEDDHIDHFAFLLHQQFGYVIRESWYIQNPEVIEKLDSTKEHIQILHSRDTEYHFNKNDKYGTDHWDCSYYDTKKIYIFDSANKKKFHQNHQTYLEKLFPDFVFNSQTVEFPDVQSQPNNFDCGVFAIAFATSLALRQWPTKSSFLFDHKQMRPHLIKLFTDNIITSFPKVSSKKLLIQSTEKKDSCYANSNNNNEISTCTTSEVIPELKNGAKQSATNNLLETIHKRKLQTTSDSEVLSKKRKYISNKSVLPFINDFYLNIVRHGAQLQGEHIYQLKLILSNCSDYNPRDTLYLARPERIKPVSQFQNHIQILYSNDKHWICSYYDSRNVYIYDSLNKFSLNNDQILFLQHLYPFLNISSQSVIFIKVQQQCNGTDCGVFAIAIAISLLYNMKPESMIYDQSLMRSHLVQIFETNIISHFPTINNGSSLNLLSLEKIRKMDRKKYHKRIERSKKPIKTDQSQLLHKCSNNKDDLIEENLLTASLHVKSPNESFLLNGSNLQQPLMESQSESLNNYKNSEKSLEQNKLPNEQCISIINNNSSSIDSCNPKQDLIVDDKNHSNQKENLSKIMKINLEDCTKRLASVIDEKILPKNYLEAQRIIKWCMCQRTFYLKVLSNTLYILKNKAEFHLSQLSSKKDNTIDDYKLICGRSLHQPSTEPYFYETSYSFENLKDRIISLNTFGHSTNILPLLKDYKAKKQWHCNNWCRVSKGLEIYKRYEHLLKFLKTICFKNLTIFLNQSFPNHSDCKLGHYLSCYRLSDLCNSDFVCVELLSPHFPSVRYIKRLIYRIRKSFNDLNDLHKALETADLEFLVSILNKMKEAGNILDQDEEGLCLDEDKIQADFGSAFIAFTKRSLDLPRFTCISCQKLVFKKDVTDLRKLRNPIQNKMWNDLIQFIEEHDPSLKTDFICLYCLRKIRDDIMPPTCLLNNMYVGRIPNEVLELNEYEKLLIQRAKAFQIVQRMGTVAKKNLPHTMRIQELKGQIFHLPLPIEETMAKICAKTDPINKHHELYIVIRSIPTKSNIIWEKLVNLENIFRVLMWLKSNNPLYTQIKLPQCPQHLREWLNSKKITFEIDTKDDKSDNAENDNNNKENYQISQIIETEINKKVIEIENDTQRDVNNSGHIINFQKSDDDSGNFDNNSLKKFSRQSVEEKKELSQVILSVIQDHSYTNVLFANDKDININSHDHAYCINSIPLQDDNVSLSIKSNNPGEVVCDENKPKVAEHEVVNTPVLNSEKLEHENRKIEKELIDENKPKAGQHKAMLTQVSNPEGSQYDQYTIYPLHDKRKNDTTTNMYQMLKIQEKALDNRVKTLDLQCVPDLYPYGQNGQFEERQTNITAFEYIKARLKSAKSRFRLNQQYLFFLLNSAHIRQLGQGVYHTLNVTNVREKFTAESYLKHLKSGELEANLTTLFSRLRNSEQFLSKPRNNLMCMIRHYGPATWFFTVSPAEWLWDDLIMYIKEINAPHFEKLSPNQAIAADPVSVSRFIDNKFQTVLEFIKSDSHPLGPLSHFFWRREYQGRGIQHFHLILWVENAPTIGVNTNEEVAEFIMKYVTCKLPNQTISPKLFKRVTTHQRHNHNSYCLRTKKSKSDSVTKACRFGFPRPVSETFILRDAATSIAGRRNLNSKNRLYDLPRTEKEVNINDYNPAVLSVWEGNMDIQFIGEKSTLLTQYVTKYSTKKESTKTSETINEIKSTKTLPQLLWKIALRSLNHREVGALEAADTLLAISLHGTDSNTVVKWLDVKMVRNRKLKTKEEIEKLDSESTNIFCPSLIDDYYPNRPKDLDDLCFYNFAKWYDITKTEPKDSTTEYYEIRQGVFLKRRLRGYLINHFRYNVANQPENYFFSLLLLFQPWRDTEELKNGFKSYTESFKYQQPMLEQASDYHEYNDEYDKGLEYIKNLIENKCKEYDNDLKSETPTSSHDAAELHIIAKELNDAAQKYDDNSSTIVEMISSMNVDQKKIFEKIKRAISSDDTKLRLYVSGEGGTGKSFLINVIKRWIREQMKQETVVTAPTGIAAFNINGLTIHRVFQLPVEHGFTPKYKQLSDGVLKALRDQLRNTTLFIIDEISMVSNITLIYIHLRLNEIFDVHDDWFGGKHIVIIGDLLQLPPVHEDPSYVSLSSENAEKHIGALGSVDIWADLFSYEELTINMRQKADKSYGELLSRVRVGAMTSADIKLLEQRKITFDINLSYIERLHKICEYIEKLPSDTVCLVPTCKQCDWINSVMTSKLPTDEITLTARDHLDCPKSMIKKVTNTLDKIEEDTSQSAGLAKTITIKIGAKVMLRRNIDVTLGLVNGSIGTVKSISKSIYGNEIQSVNILFGESNEHAIEKIKVKFKLFESAFIVREQFPICLSYAVTIHKSQGLSLKSAIIEVENTIFNVGQTYVALSRVTQLNGLHLINFDPHNVKANSLAIKEYNRLRELYRPDLPAMIVSEKRWPKEFDRLWAVEEQFIEVESKKLKNVPYTNLSSIRGIENSDANSGGFNSLIQCIFNNEIIRKLLINHDSKNQLDDNGLINLMNKYNDSKVNLKSDDIKMSIGHDSADTNTDPGQIFLKICNNYLNIKNLVQYELEYNDRCMTCNYVSSYKLMESILCISICDEKKTYILQELIDSSFGYWFPNLKYCQNCEKVKNTLTKISLLSSNQIVVLKLDLSGKKKNNLINKKKGIIKSVPKAKVLICNSIYYVVSAIFYSSTDDNNSNHYVAMIKNNSIWNQVDDENVQSVRWPANSKSAYVFFLQKK